MRFAPKSELDDFLEENPDIQLLEVLMPDYNGILRCKRIQRREFLSLFEGSFSVPKTVPFLAIRGDMYEGVDPAEIGGDPDQVLRPIEGTLVRVPWFDSPVAQVLTAYADGDEYSWIDPRSPLLKVLSRYSDSSLSPVVVTELEFYLIADGDGARPSPLLGRIPGTGLRQEGIQYCMADDLYECDAFLNDVRQACDIQKVPLTAIHSEFSPGQWEINTHHQSDPVLAGDHAMLLRRIVKSVARRHGISATFMAKPFADIAGSGMHIHASVYAADGSNIFADDDPILPPRLMPTLRHAVAGLGDTINQGMAVFAPNPNSFRRFKAGAFAPSGASWGYDHREVALRVPASSESNRRIEHRIAGADANPYFVLAAVLAGIHAGLERARDPGEPVAREADLSENTVTLPTRIDAAIKMFCEGDILPAYFGRKFVDTYAAIRQGESDDYHSRVPDLDYEWYLRAL
ncbi:MAG: glutamine synthetase [Glaciecola sp.]|jgi:glutamine synthetase|uniref:glutamine synthetase family protein n=1 Tax=Congregibacter sp. TaxID=2744308 RepID=UPI0039E340C0